MGFKLLIAEPNDDVRDALRQYFSQHGFDVRTADSGPRLNQELQCALPQALLLEPEVLCGFVSGSAPSVPTVVLTRQRETPPILPQEFRVEQRFEKPARLVEVAESLRAAACQVGAGSLCPVADTKGPARPERECGPTLPLQRPGRVTSSVDRSAGTT